jgi:hypothetical protein
VKLHTDKYLFTTSQVTQFVFTTKNGQLILFGEIIDVCFDNCSNTHIQVFKC